MPISENFENLRSEKFVNDLKEKTIKIHSVFIRSTPIMEVVTGIMIAILIFYSGKLISKGELEINNFFSFLAAMMLAYQPVRALSTLTMNINQGLSAASRILPIIDQKNNLQSKGAEVKTRWVLHLKDIKNVKMKDAFPASKPRYSYWPKEK